jgi:exopolysaccharide production protein ExoY
LSVLYQDAALDCIEVEGSELARDSDPSGRPCQHYASNPHHLRTPKEVEVSIAHGGSSVRRLKIASAVPPIHHTSLSHESHSASRRAQHLRLPQPGETAKRLLDIVGALTLALILSPVLLVVGLALVCDRGPIIYSHSRTGRHGRSFGCLKFRTMVPNADQVLRDLLHRDPDLQLEWVRDQKLRNDPRVTALGRFLRRTSLDELPQLWNVLKGDMSLVGPRPIVPEEFGRYGRRLDSYLTAKPGVTGLWQVMGRSDACYRRRVALDSYYVRKRSLLMDVLILLRTVKVVLGGRGAC